MSNLDSCISNWLFEIDNATLYQIASVVLHDTSEWIAEAKSDANVMRIGDGLDELNDWD